VTPEFFVDALVTVVHETSVEDTLNELRDGPAGRRPPKNLVRLSEWYGEKSPQDHAYIRQVVEQAVHSALFGTLCVLDGVRAIEGIGEKSEIEVFSVLGDQRSRLNPPNSPLHDIYQAQIYDRVFGKSR